MRGVGFTIDRLNVPCTRGTLASESVVASLSLPGRPPDVSVGAVPLAPGTPLAKGAPVAITWSGCYPEGSPVPLVTGRKFARAVQLLHSAGLEWACFSTRPPRTTTTTSAATTSTTGTTTTSTAVATARVLSQGTPAGTVVRAGTVIGFDMRHCPQ